MPRHYFVCKRHNGRFVAQLTKHQIQHGLRDHSLEGDWVAVETKGLSYTEFLRQSAVADWRRLSVLMKEPWTAADRDDSSIPAPNLPARGQPQMSFPSSPTSRKIRPWEVVAFVAIVGSCIYLLVRSDRALRDLVPRISEARSFDQKDQLNIGAGTGHLLIARGFARFGWIGSAALLGVAVVIAVRRTGLDRWFIGDLKDRMLTPPTADPPIPSVRAIGSALPTDRRSARR